jgi:hypothetical protein
MRYLEVLLLLLLLLLLVQVARAAPSLGAAAARTPAACCCQCIRLQWTIGGAGVQRGRRVLRHRYIKHIVRQRRCWILQLWPGAGKWALGQRVVLHGAPVHGHGGCWREGLLLLYGVAVLRRRGQGGGAKGCSRGQPRADKGRWRWGGAAPVHTPARPILLRLLAKRRRHRAKLHLMAGNAAKLEG